MTSRTGEPRLLGTVVSVASFPLKSAAGAPLQEIRVDPDGVRWDRRYAVVDRAGRVVTVADLPGLRDIVSGTDADGALWVEATGVEASRVEVPGVDGPGRRHQPDGASADLILSDLLGVPVSVTTLPGGSGLDAPVHLVSTQAVEAAGRGEHAVTDCACSISEPRANIVLDLADGSPREESWPETSDGALITVGEVVLRVLRRPGHCLGVYAEVERPGTVRVGDPIASTTVSAT